MWLALNHRRLCHPEDYYKNLRKQQEATKKKREKLEQEYEDMVQRAKRHRS